MTLLKALLDDVKNIFFFLYKYIMWLRSLMNKIIIKKTPREFLIIWRNPEQNIASRALFYLHTLCISSHINHISYVLQNIGSQKFSIFQRKHLCWSLFSIKVQTFRLAILLKSNYKTGVFLWNLRNFKEYLFYRTSPVAASSYLNLVPLRNASRISWYPSLW